MSEMQLGAVEARFADIIWGNEPVSSAEVVKFAEKELGWKKSTTYTVLKRLCEKGIFKNEGQYGAKDLRASKGACMRNRRALRRFPLRCNRNFLCGYA